MRAVSLPLPDPRPAEDPFTIPAGTILPSMSILGPAATVLLGSALVVAVGTWLAFRFGVSKRQRRLLSSFATGEVSVSPPEISAFQRLGIAGMLILGVSTVYLLAAIIFLSLFWVSPDQGGSPLLRSWILDNNLTRIATVSAILVRVSTGLQVSLALSMIAAIALENLLVPLAQAPSWLIQRGGAGGTWTMLSLAFDRLWVSRSPRAIGVAVLVLLLSLAELGLQFTSTLLISDLALQSVRGRVNVTNVPVAYTNRVNGNRQQPLPYAVAPPTTYPAFAEFRNQTQASVEDGVDFSGVVHRALLPFRTDDERLNLLSYSGWAPVIDATFACVAPRLVELNMTGTDQTAAPPGSGVDLRAALDVSFRVDGSQFEQQLIGTDFVNGDFLAADNVTACRFWMAPMSTGREIGWGTQFCFPEVGRANMVVFNLTAANAFTDTVDIVNSDLWPKKRGLNDVVVGSNSGWTTVSWKDIPGWSLSISLCNSPLDRRRTQPSLLPVNLTTIAPLEAQKVAVDQNKAVDAQNLVSWLGIETTTGDTPPSKSNQGRGLATLEDRGNWTETDYEVVSERPELADWTSLGSESDSGQSFLGDNSTLTMTYTIQPFSQTLANSKHFAVYPTYCAILQRILQQTNRPALAVQSWWTLLFAAYYYDNLATFDISAPAAVARWEPTLIPVRNAGFLAVLALAAAHLVLMAIVLWAFLARTRYAVVQDAWAAFLHASEGDVATAVVDAKGGRGGGRARTGDEVKAMLKVDGRENLMIGASKLGRGSELDTVGVMRRRTMVRYLNVTSADKGHGDGKYGPVPSTPSVSPRCHK
jgi:hypothetical protein